ncbi:DUF2529 domain-containing protein [Priestia megaterium]|nr:DUF2529 domain-containing protein [Priestia megaterium]
MLKIFTTQLSSYFKRIADKEEFNLEDGARILAQAAVGEGSIYIHGIDEMEAVTLEATKSAEPLPYAKPLQDENVSSLTPIDCVLLISRFSTDKSAINLAQKLQEKHIPFVSISAIPKDVSEPSLHELSDAHINTQLVQPLIPGEDGSRFGFPAVMTALYAYYGLAFTLKEIIEEYE